MLFYIVKGFYPLPPNRTVGVSQRSKMGCPKSFCDSPIQNSNIKLEFGYQRRKMAAEPIVFSNLKNLFKLSVYKTNWLTNEAHQKGPDKMLNDNKSRERDSEIINYCLVDASFVWTEYLFCIPISFEFRTNEEWYKLTIRLRTLWVQTESFITNSKVVFSLNFRGYSSSSKNII